MVSRKSSNFRIQLKNTLYSIRILRFHSVTPELILRNYSLLRLYQVKHINLKSNHALDCIICLRTKVKQIYKSNNYIIRLLHTISFNYYSVKILTVPLIFWMVSRNYISDSAMHDLLFYKTFYKDNKRGEWALYEKLKIKYPDPFIILKNLKKTDGKYKKIIKNIISNPIFLLLAYIKTKPGFIVRDDSIDKNLINFNSY